MFWVEVRRIGDAKDPQDEDPQYEDPLIRWNDIPSYIPLCRDRAGRALPWRMTMMNDKTTKMNDTITTMNDTITDRDEWQRGHDEHCIMTSECTEHMGL